VGKRADVLVVDGDVVADISLLDCRERFIAVMEAVIVTARRSLNPKAHRS
jgi:hypothetical protein